MARFFLVAGALALAIAVGMGAISAHAAKEAAHPDAARLMQTAVLYQFVHGLGLVGVGILARTGASRWLTASGIFLVAGIVCFCGSIFVLALAGVSLGPLAPLGGIAFIFGWLNLAVYALVDFVIPA
jgi:uncharacterized membrane protein YgdD (TMEM256/DUF423 family)